LLLLPFLLFLFGIFLGYRRASTSSLPFSLIYSSVRRPSQLPFSVFFYYFRCAILPCLDLICRVPYLGKGRVSVRPFLSYLFLLVALSDCRGLSMILRPMIFSSFVVNGFDPVTQRNTKTYFYFHSALFSPTPLFCSPITVKPPTSTFRFASLALRRVPHLHGF